MLVRGFALAALAMQDDSPIEQARAIAEVMTIYLDAGNHTHLRSFARTAIRLLRLLGDADGATILDGATRGQPSFRNGAQGTGTTSVDGSRADGTAADGGDLRAVGAAMTDAALVRWLSERLGTSPTTS
ncbi:MAG: hypothetical protein QM733_19490 [Ilumatobacteraceae bacterium]